MEKIPLADWAAKQDRLLTTENAWRIKTRIKGLKRIGRQWFVDSNAPDPRRKWGTKRKGRKQ